MSREDERLEEFRRQVIWEWRGCDDPGESMANVRHASEFLDLVIEDAGTAEGMDEERLREAWSRLAGDLIASQCEPVGFRDGEIRLRVLQPAMRFHLEQIKAMLVQRLREELGDERVRSVKFELG